MDETTQTEPTDGDVVDVAVHVPFEQFYRTSLPTITRALALTLGNADLAADAANEGMTRAYGRWTKVGSYDNPQGWVYRVALNWARSRLRRRRREVLTVYREPTHTPALPDPALDEALADLSVEHRAVVVCRYLLDWSEAQTAAALGIAPGTVKSRLSRALDRLQPALDERPPAGGPR